MITETMLARRWLFGLLLCSALALISGRASACMDFGPAEMALMPQYCQVKCSLGNDRDNPKVARWMKILGAGNYIHLHHYCFALGFEQRYRRETDKNKRDFILGQISRNYEYVIERWPKDMRLYPEAHTRYAMTLAGAGQAGAAVAHFQSALNARPDYAPAYAAYSDWLVSQGKKSEAADLLKRGLQQAPTSKLLRSRMAKLD